MTDVVYVLGSGSNWKNNELRFSLRSIEKYGLNVGKIFVVGERPEFLSEDIIHIEAEDIFIPTVNADGNIAHKVAIACADQRLSDDFLFINDDHLLLKPIDIKDIPAFHKGDMNSFPASYFELNYWRSRLKRTRDILNKKGCTAYHFDCHTPIMFNKQAFLAVMNEFPIGEGIGLTMKSLYGNSVYPETGILLTGEKKTVFANYTETQLCDRLKHCGFMSFNDFGLNKPLKIWLYKTFPIRSKWEISETEDKHMTILKWMDDGYDYDQGVEIFQKYMHGVHLLHLFLTTKTDALHKKLTYKLTQAITE